MEVLDTPTLIRIAKEADATVIVDNTWLTPYLLQPFRRGADLVIHSVTKYMGGQGNAMGGVVSGRKDLVGRIESAQNWLGGLMRPMDAFLVTQGVKTLPLRMRQHSRSARLVAEFLRSHEAVSRVHYGGLPSWNRNAEPDAPKGFGGMLGVEWKSDAVHQNLGRHVKLMINAVSLGDPVTRVSQRREEPDRGIPARYTRVSIGLAAGHGEASGIEIHVTSPRAAQKRLRPDRGTVARRSKSTQTRPDPVSPVSNGKLSAPTSAGRRPASRLLRRVRGCIPRVRRASTRPAIAHFAGRRAGRWAPRPRELLARRRVLSSMRIRLSRSRSWTYRTPSVVAVMFQGYRRVCGGTPPTCRTSPTSSGASKRTDGTGLPASDVLDSAGVPGQHERRAGSGTCVLYPTVRNSTPCGTKRAMEVEHFGPFLEEANMWVTRAITLWSLVLATLAMGQEPFSPVRPVVEIEEEVYSYEPADNGASPTWCFGAPILVRSGETLFASGLETLADAKPLHNVRWMLFRRDAEGWELQQVDPVDRTREPCPLVILPSGRLVMSTNPTLVTDPERRAGPARPEMLVFDAADPQAAPRTLLPEWEGQPSFTEHTYRLFGADAEHGEVILLNNVGYSHKEWALWQRDGTWATGRLMNVASRPGDLHAYRPGYNWHRFNYGSVVLRDRAAFVTGCVSYANWDRAGEAELEEILAGQTARNRLGSLANRRRMMFAWTPDITTTPFSPWLEVGSTMSNGGWLFPGDLYVAADGTAHVVWYEGPMDRRLRDEHFPDIELTHAIRHAMVRDGQVVHRATLMEGGEGLGSELPQSIQPRFHITPDERLFVWIYVGGRNRHGEPVAENRMIELSADGTPGEPMSVPLEHPFRVAFTATPRGGSPPSNTLDLFGIRAGGPPTTLCYARVRLDD